MAQEQEKKCKYCNFWWQKSSYEKLMRKLENKKGSG
jgi:hypothetical protein